MRYIITGFSICLSSTNDYALHPGISNPRQWCIHHFQRRPCQRTLRCSTCRRKRSTLASRLLTSLSSLTVSETAPALDFHHIDLLAHFDRERIPERVVRIAFPSARTKMTLRFRYTPKVQVPMVTSH
jgi:hypothetical protein